MKTLREQLGSSDSETVRDSIHGIALPELCIPDHTLNTGDDFLVCIKALFDAEAGDIQKLKVRVEDMVELTQAIQDISFEYADTLARLHGVQIWNPRLLYGVQILDVRNA